MSNTTFKIAGDNLYLSTPFSKVDTEKRMVHGFATLDNIDKVDDIVLAEASESAFERFRGNIREMHEMKAVGRMISFRPETYYDVETGQVLKGIFVSTYVSKGAQDTWEKVLDGTLTGFSIGAVVNKTSNRYDEELDKVIRVIEDYDLVELSLVDNPMNQLANVVSFEKGVQTGYISEVNSENVFYCRVHNVVQFSGGTYADCHQCGGSMSNIGFVEADDPEKVAVVKGLLSNIRNAPIVGDIVEFDEGVGHVDAVYVEGEVMIEESDVAFKASEIEPIAIISICNKNGDTLVKTDSRIVKELSSITKKKGVEKMSEELKDVVEETTPEDIEPETEEAVAVSEEPVAEEVATVDNDKIVEKADLSELKEMVSEITKALAGIVESFKTVAESSIEAQKSAADANEAVKSAKADLEKANGEIKELGEQVKRVDSATAVRKSADVGDIEQAVPQEVQSIWGGSFLGNTTARN